MTPLHDDSGYLDEVTSCLAQSIVYLLEIRPQDPIEFLALSLKNHRRLHPRLSQGESTNSATDDFGKENTVASGDTESLVKTTEVSTVNLCDTVGAPVPQRNLSARAAMPVDVDDNHDDGIEDSFFIMKDKFVHKQLKDIFNVIGDICDDDDFG